jgi:chromosome partitioning protein
MAHVVVVGNEKGGSGKSTTAMHIATALARDGRAVGVIDLDLRQRSLGRYLENRRAWAAARDLSLPSPREARLPDRANTGANTGADAGADAGAQLAAALAALADCEVVVIDCPGAQTPLAQQAHALADTLITPLNDSFVDFDLLARVDPATGRVLGPSVYAEAVWQARQARAAAGRRALDWVVLRNRVGAQAMHNKRRMGEALAQLARRIGFRVVPGLSERVVFRELFPKGLTLLDLREPGSAAGGLSLSQVAARQELRALIAALNLPSARGAA